MPYVYTQNGTSDIVSGASSGRVGIGTSSPGATLHVSGGDILVDNNKQIQAKNTGGSVLRIMDLDDGNNLNIGRDDSIGTTQFFGEIGIYDDAASPSLKISITPTGTVYFNTGGKVGIGTTNPKRALSVYAGSQNLSALHLHAETTISSSVDSALDAGDNGMIVIVRDVTSGGTCLVIYDKGNDPVVIGQSGSVSTIFTSSSPQQDQIQVKKRTDSTGGIQLRAGANRNGNTVRYGIIICDGD